MTFDSEKKKSMKAHKTTKRNSDMLVTMGYHLGEEKHYNIDVEWSPLSEERNFNLCFINDISSTNENVGKILVKEVIVDRD